VGVIGGLEIATLSLAMTGFFEVVVYFWFLLFLYNNSFNFEGGRNWWFGDCHAIARNDGVFVVVVFF